MLAVADAYHYVVITFSTSFGLLMTITLHFVIFQKCKKKKEKKKKNFSYELRIPEKLKTYSEYITESRLVVVYIEKDGPRRHSGDGGLAERDGK